MILKNIGEKFDTAEIQSSHHYLPLLFPSSRVGLFTDTTIEIPAAIIHDVQVP